MQVNEAKDTQADRASSPRPAQASSVLRSCQTCVAYAPESEMRALNDGRMVCATCDRRIRRLTAERAQLSMFGQDHLF